MSTAKKGVSGGRSGPLLDINSYQIQPPGWAIAQTLAVQGKPAWAASGGKDVAGPNRHRGNSYLRAGPSLEGFQRFLRACERLIWLLDGSISGGKHTNSCRG